MTRQMVRGGAELEIPSADETAAAVDQRHRDFWHEQRAIEDARQRAELRAVKFMRFPQIYGVASGSKLALGASFNVGPQSGYVWSLLRVIVNGMTTGSTPDVVNLYVNDANTQPIWQFNGNNFGYAFRPGQMIINQDEILLLASVGTFSATGTITMSGAMVEVPAEMAGKLLNL